jgi:hypothetical protein
MEISKTNHVFYEIEYDLVVECMSNRHVTDVETYEKSIELYFVRRGQFRHLYKLPNVHPTAIIMFVLDLTRVN